MSLGWIKKITAKQVLGMCLVMVAIYFMVGENSGEGEELNQVGSVGDSYQTEVVEEGHVIYVVHDSGYVVKTMARIDSEVSEVESIFTALLTDSDRLPEQTRGLIPAGAVLRDYSASEGVLTLNVSESFLYYMPSDEENLLSSLVWSMTELEQVERVYLQIEGERVHNLNSSVDVGRGLTRSVGINLEVDAPFTHDAELVMLYFLTSDSENAMLVPVTRLVAPDVDVMEYVVSSLVRGPVGTNYISVFNHRTTLIDPPHLENGILTLNFCSELFYNQEQTLVSSQALRQLVMTMTEFDEVYEVSVIIEGSVRVFDEGGTPVVIPVSRSTILEQEFIERQ